MATLSMTVGDTRTFRLLVTLAGVPVDLTGIQSLAYTLQRAGGAIVAQWGLGSGVELTDAAAGEATLTVTPDMLSWCTTNLYCSYAWALVDALGIRTGLLDTGSMALTLSP